MAKRCGYDSVQQAERILAAEGEGAGGSPSSDKDPGGRSGKASESVKSPSPATGGQGGSAGSVSPESDKESNAAGEGREKEGEKGAEKRKREKGDGQGSYGRGVSEGQQKRAKQDPALHLNGKLRADREGSEDPVMGPRNTTDRFIDMLEHTADKDSGVFEKL
eukprot:3937648-Rhodomonas_salina.1